MGTRKGERTPLNDQSSTSRQNQSYQGYPLEQKVKFKLVEKSSECGLEKCNCSNITPESSCVFIEKDTDVMRKIVTFNGNEGTTQAECTRLSSLTKPEVVYEFLYNTLGFHQSRSTLLISIIGSASAYVQNEAFEDIFKEGLARVATQSHAWVFTGGSNVGIMKLTGNTLKKLSQLNSTASEHDQQRKVRCVGILPWGVLPKDLQDHIGSTNAVNERKPINAIKSFLEPNHTHFLFADDGTTNNYFSETGFRHNLEKTMMQKKKSDNQKLKSRNKAFAAVKLVVGGGPTTIDLVLDTIKFGMPVILFSGTTQAATLFSYAYQLKSLEDPNLLQIEEHQYLIELIGKEYPDFTQEMKIECYGKIMECMKLKEYITIGTLAKDYPLERIILDALLKVEDVKDQIYLAIQWGVIEQTKKLIDEELEKSEVAFEDMKNWTLYALRKRTRHAEASYIIDSILNMASLTDKCKNDFKNSVAKEVTKLYKHARSKLGRNILHLMTTKETFTDDDINTDIYPMLKDFGDVDVLNTQNNPMLTLLNYCLLANMKEMAVIFIRYGNYKLAKLLFAYKIFKRMNEYYVRHTPVEVKKMKILLASSESYFRDLAFKMLQKCSQKQELLTRRILLQRLHKFACKTCLNLAASVNHIEFVAADSCQVVLSDDVWFGKLVIPGSNYWLWRALKMVPCLLPPLYLLLRYKTDERERSEGKTETYIKNHSLQDDYSFGTVWKKTKYFYTAPVVKCIVNYASYLIFLVLFTYALTHKKDTDPSVIEWIIFTYCIAFVIEEVMQIVGAPIGHSLYQRFRYYCTLHSNILDWMALTLYFVAFGLRLNQATINEAHILYAIDVSMWYFRLLKLFTLFPTIGPYIEMIMQMLVDLTHFLFVLVVFLLGYGIARFAILSPYNDSARLALDGIWTVPYRQVFADSLEESDVKVPKNTTAFGIEYSSVAVYIVEVLMGLYTLLAAILLINLLIARFSFTYGKVQDQSTVVWKFGRYYTLTEITDRSVLPPPFSVLVNVYTLVKWFIDYVRGIKDEETDLSADDIEELEGFQTACLDECLKELSTDELSETAKLNDVSMIHEVPIQNVPRQSQEVDSVDEKTKPKPFHLPVDVYYPLSTSKRLPVADDKKAWSVPCPGYDENVTKVGNTMDVSLLEKNSLGRTGVTGKGCLSKYGTNEIIEAVVTRWKVLLSGVAEDRCGKKILQVLVERSNLLGVYALPMGNASVDSPLPPVLADLLKVDNLKDKTLWLEPERIALYEEMKNRIITNGREIWKGTVEDARNTDEAWIESTVVNFHDQDGTIIDKYLQSSNSKKFNLSWIDIDSCLPMRRRHMSYLTILAKQCGAHF